MQTGNLEAKISIVVKAEAANVWQAFVNPALVKKYMAGTTVVSDWKEGSPITWEGEWKGKAYKDKGKILSIEPPHHLQYTHFSALAGQDDVPENYHTVTIDLMPTAEGTTVSLIQDKNATPQAKEESEKNWSMMLAALKKLVEESSAKA